MVDLFVNAPMEEDEDPPLPDEVEDEDHPPLLDEDEEDHPPLLDEDEEDHLPLRWPTSMSMLPPAMKMGWVAILPPTPMLPTLLVQEGFDNSVIS